MENIRPLNDSYLCPIYFQRFDTMKFLIAAPQYSPQSGGIMVLHDLCESLNKIGHTAAIVLFHNGNAVEQNFEFVISNNPSHHKPSVDFYKFSTEYNHEISDFLLNGIVIYPDLILGNPLNAKRTIRYILNTTNKKFENDYVLSFSKIFYDSPNFILYKVFENPYIHDAGARPWEARTLNATYIGKGSTFGPCETIKNSILIERDWPKSKEQLGILLRQVKFFYTWDNVSATNYDAVLCGCVPVLLSNYSIDKQKIDTMEPGKFPQIDLENRDLNGDINIDMNHLSETLSTMKREIKYLSTSWNERVVEFALHCEQYF